MNNQTDKELPQPNRIAVLVARFESIPLGGFGLKDQIFLAKRLSFLSKAGIPLIESFNIIRDQTKSKAKSRILDSIISDIAAGQYLATSLAKNRRVFGDFAVNLIRVGETSGILTENLSYLADELAKRRALRNKVLGALIYPAFITVATLGITILLTVYIFPKIMPIFTSLHVPLPFTTRALIAISAYMRSWGLLTLVVLAALVVLFLYLRYRYQAVRVAADRALLRVPFAGPIVESYNLANFTRTLGLMLKSGVPVATALVVAADTTANRVYSDAYRSIADSVTKGEPISRGIQNANARFPDLLTHMIAVGEQTGSLAQTLLYLAELYELEVDEQTKNLSSSIEPILMLVMGAIVGLIAVSVITPIYEITQHLSPK